MIGKNFQVGLLLLAGYYCHGRADTEFLQELVQSTSNLTVNAAASFPVGQPVLDIGSILRPLVEYHAFSLLACTLLCVQYHSLDCAAFIYAENSQICQLYEVFNMSLLASAGGMFNNTGQQYYCRLNMLNTLANIYWSSSSSSSTASTTLNTTSTTLTTLPTTTTATSTTSMPYLSCSTNVTLLGQNLTINFTSGSHTFICGCYNGIQIGQTTHSFPNAFTACLFNCTAQPSCRYFAFLESNNTCHTSNGGYKSNNTSGAIITCQK